MGSTVKLNTFMKNVTVRFPRHLRDLWSPLKITKNVSWSLTVRLNILFFAKRFSLFGPSNFLIVRDRTMLLGAFLMKKKPYELNIFSYRYVFIYLCRFWFASPFNILNLNGIILLWITVTVNMWNSIAVLDSTKWGELVCGLVVVFFPPLAGYCESALFPLQTLKTSWPRCLAMGSLG